MEALILDTSFNAVAIIDSFDNFIWTDRYSAYGDFELYCAIDEQNLSNLREDYYIVMRDSEHVMVIENIQIDSDVEDGPQLAISGRSLESILDRRIIWNQTVLSGGLQPSILRLLHENIIGPADPNRRIPNFVFRPNKDPAVSNITLANEAQFTGDNLYDVIKSLCDVFGIGFKITLSTDGKFVFELYAGADRSYEQTTNPYVVFSPRFENLFNSRYIQSKTNLKNVTLVAGEGEGSERKTVTVGEGSGIDRRELYTDARDISQTVGGETITDGAYNAQLAERGREKLAECVEVKSFEGESLPNVTYTFGEDYFIGDIVQIENEYGIGSRSRIGEIVRSESGSGFEMYPTFIQV